MIRADLIPNVYWDYGGRAGLYTQPGIGLPLNDYLGQETIDKYYPSYIDMFSTDGILYGLPCTSWATVGWVDTELLEQAGAMDVLDDGIFTYEELEDVTRALRKDGGEYYATGLFAAETGGDYYLYTFWLAGHGAKLYNIDGSIALNSPEGIEALELLKRWYDDGLLPYGAAGLKDIDYAAQLLYEGNTVAASYAAAVPAIEFDPLFMSTVHKLDVEFAPVASGIQVVVAFDTGTEEQKKAAAELVKYIASAENQQMRVDRGRFPSMFGVDLSNMRPKIKIAAENMAVNGVFDMGLGKPHYVAMRFLWQTMLQAILTNDTDEWAKDLGKKTDGSIAGALAVFEERGNELIAEMAR